MGKPTQIHLLYAQRTIQPSLSAADTNDLISAHRARGINVRRVARDDSDLFLAPPSPPNPPVRLSEQDADSDHDHESESESGSDSEKDRRKDLKERGRQKEKGKGLKWFLQLRGKSA
jgi:hypothetical protein